MGEAASGPAALSAINALTPDVVFLDIQMPGVTGTDVLRQAVHQPFVVFTTAFAEHAVTAFELGALDYLLKPFGPERLAAAMERVHKRDDAIDFQRNEFRFQDNNRRNVTTCHPSTKQYPAQYSPLSASQLWPFWRYTGSSSSTDARDFL